MLKTIAIAGGLTTALFAAAALLTAPAMAQASPWCSGHASVMNGQIIVDSETPAGGQDSGCEVLVGPDGHLAVQNGGDTKADDGINATHEGAGGGHTS